MKIIFKAFLLLPFLAVATCDLSPEDEDKMFNDYLVSLPKF